LMVVLACSRWPGVMPANFSAAYALAFCAGLYFPKVMAWVLPLATLLITVPGYPPTWTFFWKTLLSSGLFSGLFIGSMKAVESMEEAKQEEEAEEQESAGEDAEEPAPSA
jgi:hypothetical protein